MQGSYNMILQKAYKTWKDIQLTFFVELGIQADLIILYNIVKI